MSAAVGSRGMSFGTKYPYFFGFWMLLIILHGAVEGREMNEIAATVHQPIGEVSYRQSLLRCCLHVDIWVFHKERHCLVLRVEHKIVGADISIIVPLLQGEEAETIATTVVFAYEARRLTSSARSCE